MSAYPEERRRGAVLAGLTVLALLLGGAWWTRSDPRADADAAPPAPVPYAARRPGGVSGAGADPTGGVARRGDPQAGVSVVIDGSTGQVIADPDTPIFLGGSWPGSSRVGSVRWRETRLLTDNVRALRRQIVATPGDRYRLLLLCGGSGDLRVRVANARVWRGLDGAPCDGALHDLGMTATGGPLVVQIAHPRQGAVELTAILVAQG